MHGDSDCERKRARDQVWCRHVFDYGSVDVLWRNPENPAVLPHRYWELRAIGRDGSVRYQWHRYDQLVSLTGGLSLVGSPPFFSLQIPQNPHSISAKLETHS